jgi:DNA-binding response OmpR family regulator
LGGITVGSKKILVVDEDGFYRICSAILASEGFVTELFTDIENLSLSLGNDKFGLILMSYPYGAFLLNELKKWNIATIILTDTLDGSLMDLLNGLSNSYCMVKPIDYQKFRALIHEVMSDHCATQKGYNIV